MAIGEGIIAFFNRLFGREDGAEIRCAELNKLEVELSARQLAFQSSTDMIARSLAKCEIKTFVGGVEKKEADYYRLNIAPNRNEISSAWFQKLVFNLYRDGEALVVGIGDDLLVADAFQKKKRALYDWIFTEVEIDDFRPDRPFFMPEVMYFRLNRQNVKKVVDQIGEAHARLMAVAKKSFEMSGGVRGILSLTGTMPGDNKKRDTYAEEVTKRFASLANNQNGIVILPSGHQYQNLNTEKKSIMTTRDYRSLVDDVIDFTAIAFGIPPLLLKGQVAGVEDVYNMYLTGCIDPLADLIETEINRQMYGQKSLIAGTYCKIDTRQIKHFELFETASAIDKLIGSGTLTINEVRKKLGEPVSDDPVADTHLVTKNYGTAEEVTGGSKTENDD